MQDDSRVGVVFNPTKDYSKVESYIRLASERDSMLRFEVFCTESFEDIERKARLAYASGCGRCVAAGGDGTVLGVLNAAVEHDACFSVLPLGTGNDFAKMLGIDGVEGAVEALLRGTVKAVDAGLCEYRGDDGSRTRMYFGSTAGVGLVAAMFSYERRAVTRFLKNVLGNGVWPLLTIMSLVTGGSVQAELQLNDTRIRADMRLFEASKVRAAGGTVFTPDAAPDNGFFDAWMLHDAGAFRALDFFAKSGRPGMRHLDCGGLSRFSGEAGLNRFGCAKLTRIAVTTERPMHVHLNGDRVGTTPCRMELLPGRLKVLC